MFHFARALEGLTNEEKSLDSFVVWALQVGKLEKNILMAIAVVRLVFCYVTSPALFAQFTAYTTDE